MDEPLPRMLITGASGFLGRRLVRSLREEWQIIGLARRSQGEVGLDRHPNVEWHQVDIADWPSLNKVFRKIHEDGPVPIVIHLAAHYDFSGVEDPEYIRTNIVGLRQVLEQCRDQGVRLFVFSSSTAACSFPAPGTCLTESSPADGHHIYARSKAGGEEMVREYAYAFKPVIVRFAALFSDWCEYVPLYMFLRTWLSHAWNSRVLGGRGESAIPYLHVQDAVLFLRHLLARWESLEPGEVLLASPDGSTTHRQLYEAATFYHYQEPRPALHVPKPLVRPGIRARCLLSRLTREECFERPWMADYIDRRMDMDAGLTRARLAWQPRARLEILHRLPFMLEYRKSDNAEWVRRNYDAMKRVHLRPNLKIYTLLDEHADEIGEESTRALRARFESYGKIDEAEHRWNHRLILRHLMNAVRTRERAPFLTYCSDLAERRREQGFAADELIGALEVLARVCEEVLGRDEKAKDVMPYLFEHVTMPMRLGCDTALQVYEEYEQREVLTRPLPSLKRP